jgi:hypothetical protein
MKWAAVLAVIFAVACGSASTASAPMPAASGRLPSASASGLVSSASPTGQGGGTSTAEPTTPSPAPGTPRAATFAVLLDLFAGGNAYNVALVGVDGRVAARAHAQLRSAIRDASELPYVNASNSRVYYLDGDSRIRWLKADGTTGAAETVPGGPEVHATFAVTPDDSRIAVALLDYSVYPVRLTLYVEDIGGAHHSVIFTSTDHYVWPVAWHAGQLVVAYLGPGAVPFKSKTNFYSGGDLTRYPYGPDPYGGINLHVINPVTALREAIISGGGASGMLTRSGTAVVQGDAVDWNGQPIFWNSPHDYGTYSAAGSLSPNGQVIAACCEQPGSAGHLVLWYPGDQMRVLAVTVTANDWVGWLDDSHLVTGFYQSADGTPSVVDLSSNTLTSVDAHGIVAAILPGGLDS